MLAKIVSNKYTEFGSCVSSRGARFRRMNQKKRWTRQKGRTVSNQERTYVSVKIGNRVELRLQVADCLTAQRDSLTPDSPAPIRVRFVFQWIYANQCVIG